MSIFQVQAEDLTAIGTRLAANEREVEPEDRKRRSKRFNMDIESDVITS